MSALERDNYLCMRYLLMKNKWQHCSNLNWTQRYGRTFKTMYCFADCYKLEQTTVWQCMLNRASLCMLVHYVATWVWHCLDSTQQICETVSMKFSKTHCHENLRYSILYTAMWQFTHTNTSSGSETLVLHLYEYRTCTIYKSTSYTCWCYEYSTLTSTISFISNANRRHIIVKQLYMYKIPCPGSEILVLHSGSSCNIYLYVLI